MFQDRFGARDRDNVRLQELLKRTLAQMMEQRRDVVTAQRDESAVTFSITPMPNGTERHIVIMEAPTSTASPAMAGPSSSSSRPGAGPSSSSSARGAGSSSSSTRKGAGPSSSSAAATSSREPRPVREDGACKIQLKSWAEDLEEHQQDDGDGLEDLRHTVEVARGILVGPEESWDQVDRLASELARELKRKLIQCFKERQEERDKKDE